MSNRIFTAVFQLLQAKLQNKLQLQSVHLQESLPGQHLRTVPALGLQSAVRQSRGDPGEAGAALPGGGAGQGVREVRQGESQQAPAQSEDPVGSQPGGSRGGRGGKSGDV